MRSKLLVMIAGMTMAALCTCPVSGATTAPLPGTVIKIGVLTDLSGVYSAVGGKGAVDAVTMAADDFMRANPRFSVEVVYADHQNKPDIAALKAREWIDTQHVDMIVDLASTAAALAVIDVAKEKNTITIATGPSASDITNAKCSPVSIQYVYDTYALAHGAGETMTRQGGKSWYFIAANYAFGEALVRDTSEAVKQNGGNVVGTVRAPLNATDFSSYVMQAKSSGANVIALANAGGDFVSAVKTADEFGVARSGQRIAGLLVFITDIHALGLRTAQGLEFATAFYWDMNDATRQWSRRYFERERMMPTQVQAGDYSATMHYLEAVKAAGTLDTASVMTEMRDMPVNDFFATNGRIREDGLMVHDMYLIRVKTPEQSQRPWDYYSVKAVIPASDAFPPLSQSACPLVTH